MRKAKIKYPKLPKSQADIVKARNECLRAFHNHRLADFELSLTAPDTKHDTKHDTGQVEKSAFILQMSFDDAHPLYIGVRKADWLLPLNHLTTPWQWADLSPFLAQTALSYVLEDWIGRFSSPSQLRLTKIILNHSHKTKSQKGQKSQKEKAKDFLSSFNHYPLTLQNQNDCEIIDLWTKSDFPFHLLARHLGAEKMADDYPHSLHITMPIQIATTLCVANDITKLKAGDVIVI